MANHRKRFNDWVGLRNCRAQSDKDTEPAPAPSATPTALRAAACAPSAVVFPRVPPLFTVLDPVLLAALSAAGFSPSRLAQPSGSLVESDASLVWRSVDRTGKRRPPTRARARYSDPVHALRRQAAAGYPQGWNNRRLPEAFLRRGLKRWGHEKIACVPPVARAASRWRSYGAGKARNTSR